MNDWTPEEEQWLDAHYDTFGIATCAKYLSRSMSAVRTKAWRLRGLKIVDGGLDFNGAAQALNAYIGFASNSAALAKQENARKPSHTVGILPCLHIPFQAKLNFAELLVMDLPVDELVIAGDFLDCLSVGSHTYRRNIRPDHYVALREEMAVGKAILTTLAARFPRITIMRGNHLDRVRKFFADRVPLELMFLVQYDIMSLLAADFPNVVVVNQEDVNGNDLSWIYQIGDVRICHAELGSSTDLKPTVKLDKWFAEWDYLLRDSADLKPYRVLVECHTHQAGIVYANAGRKVLIEGGCMCLEPQYALEPTAAYSRPQTNAMTLLTLQDGKVDTSSIRQVVFEGIA